mgnify:CR=1 FL=1
MSFGTYNILEEDKIQWDKQLQKFELVVNSYRLQDGFKNYKSVTYHIKDCKNGTMEWIIGR